MKKLRQGFTLIELLVVISIIALLSTLAVVSLNSTREKSRDAKRVSDIKQLQTALELYYAGTTAYPVATKTMGATDATCLSSGSGFASVCSGTTYMGQVPSDPTSSGGYRYIYTAASGSAYTLTFVLEGQTGSLGTGTHTASPSGIQ